ncbi:MAG TPA: hypothetical protein VGS13_06860 [Stellaceae bacterium]|nr:hypothetical protein [Stellaceae bacterium]
MLTFNPAVNETLLLMATYGLHLMGKPHEILEKSLITWFMLHEPQFFERNVLADLAPNETLDSFRGANKQQFFEICQLVFRERIVTNDEITRAVSIGL